MKHFALLYREGARPLSPVEQKRRAEEVRAWAVRTNKQGHQLDSRIFQKDGHTLARARSGKNAPVIAVTFLDARDLEEAVRIAQTHPGLQYGVTIEVREWTAPPTPPETK